ncbi:hypothetical protein [Mesorhizobium sp. 2RAF21]|uniref:hypothetical protein n=1 Tax=Mesorhizobium sp. 2RAF21 TaxID=3232995 RepID=UPI003F98ED9F
MTLWQENLEQLLRLVGELLQTANEYVGPCDAVDYANWRTRSSAADQHIRERLEHEADARFTQNGDVYMVRMASIRSTSTAGWNAALANWRAAARTRLVQACDPINLQGSGPAPILPREV